MVNRKLAIAAGLALTLALFAPALAEYEETSCRMTFDLKGWSAFYKTAKGAGTITCDNGQTASVKIRTRGGGITFGKSELTDGTGVFSKVGDISVLYGAYAQAEAHAGAKKSVAAQAMTKGKVSLSLVGKGQGVDIGFSFGKFTIKPVESGE